MQLPLLAGASARHAAKRTHSNFGATPLAYPAHSTHLPVFSRAEPRGALIRATPRRDINRLASPTRPTPKAAMFEMLPPDESVVGLNADNQAVLQSEVRKALDGLSFFAQMAAKGTLTRDFGKNVLSLAEFALANITKVTGIETNSAAEQELRYAATRAANTRVRELEAKLGEAASTEHVQMGLKDFGKKLNSWWDLEGFGHITEMSFSEHGSCRVEFSCSLFGTTFLVDSPTPISDKEKDALWKASLKERGFVLATDDRDSLVDCDASRAVLARLFTERLPSSHIAGFTNHGSPNGLLKMRSVKLFIGNLDEIRMLPQLPTPRKE